MGSLYFADLRDCVKNKLGVNFSLQEFHKKVLEIGPCPFSILKKEIALAFYPHEWYHKSRLNNISDSGG